ncbi:MAG: FAD-dependent oxidoreductase, partial [Terriglobia bacterium]
DDSRFRDRARKFCDELRADGARVFVQLAYPAADKGGHDLVRTLDIDGIREIEEKFVEGAVAAVTAGFDGVEIQGAYGGLLSRFLSPLSNGRDDVFGGRLKNRARFLTETVAAVRARVQGVPVQVKLVGDEYRAGGFGPDEAAKVAKWLEEAGADSLVVSAGTKETKKYAIPPHSLAPGILVPLAARIKRAVKIPVVATGKIKSPDLCEQIIGSKEADFIAVTRALVADPDFPRKLEDGRVEEIRGCISCNACTAKHDEKPRRRCTVNPALLEEMDFQVSPVPADQRKRVAVVGGGPAGLAAAVYGRQRGHEVELYEKDAKLGGAFKLAPIAPFKEEVSELVRYLADQVERHDVRVLLNHPADVDEIVHRDPDVVFVATGSKAFRPIPGSERDVVVDSYAFFEGVGRADYGGRKVVVVGGGSTGCEAAEILADQGAIVTVVEMSKEILLDLNKIDRKDLGGRLEEKKVDIVSAARATKITDAAVELEQDGKIRSIAADAVIMAITRRPRNDLVDQLKDKVPSVIAVGDASTVGDAGAAIRSAALKAHKL